jgi:hypothetical protein
MAVGMRIRITPILAGLLIGVPGARAAATDDTDAAIIATVLRFIDALEAGDGKTLEQVINVLDSPAQERSRKSFVELALAQKALEKSAIKAFGEEGKRFHCGFNLIVSVGDRKAIAGAKVIYDDPRIAHIQKAGEVMPMQLRRAPGPDGQWQVVLEHIDLEEDPDLYPGPYPFPGMAKHSALAAIKVTHQNAIVAAFRATQARIDSGELANAETARTDLLGRLAAADAEAAKARAAVPSGRPKDRQ